MALIKRSVKGTNLSPSEVDANFEFVGELGTSTSNTILFDRLFNRHGSWATPLTGALVLDNTGAVDGATTVVIWSGSSNPTMSGVTIQSQSGEITTSGTYSIYFNYLDSRLNVSIFNVDRNCHNEHSTKYINDNRSDSNKCSKYSTGHFNNNRSNNNIEYGNNTNNSNGLR